MPPRKRETRQKQNTSGRSAPSDTSDDQSKDHAVEPANGSTRRGSGASGRVRLRVTKQPDHYWLEFRPLDRRVDLKGTLRIRKSKVKGVIGATDRSKGEVRRRNGRLEFRDKNFPEWTRAEYHETYREFFLRANEGDWGDNAPERGEAEHDETSFIEYQSGWANNPPKWDEIVDDEGRRIFRLPARPADQETGREYGWWYHNGVVLIDMDNHPLRHIPDLNETFSTALEGWRLDACKKLLPDTKIEDYRGRMPHIRVINGKREPTPLFAAFTNRAWRFRKAHNVPDWSVRTQPRHPPRKSRAASRAKQQDAGRVITAGEEDFDEDEDAENYYQGRVEGDPYTESTSLHHPSQSQQYSYDDSQSAINTQFEVDTHRAMAPSAPSLDTQSVIERQTARFGQGVRLVALFATLQDEAQAALQDSRLITPEDVMSAWEGTKGFSAGIAAGVYLVLRPANAPRAVDAHGVHQYVADLTIEEIAALADQAAANPNLEWFEG